MSDEFNLYKRIVSAVDGSPYSNLAIEAALALAEKCDRPLLAGCHIYAAQLHRNRFGDMEPGLPDSYRRDELEKLRGTHEDLITDGLKIISDSYLEPLAKKAEEKGIPCRGIALEGRNYKGIVRVARDQNADLLVLGAQGHGGQSDLGSTAERVLLYSSTGTGDILVIRGPWDLDGRPIVVGVDGSENSYSALIAAAEIARAFNAELKAVSVYDPHFHTNVFKNIAASLSEDAREKFDLPSQEKLHDEIIGEGLERLYKDGLEKGALLASSRGIRAETEVLAGKVTPQILRYASDQNAGLVVVGRWGLHREPESLIGSNSLNLARLCSCNVLVVSPSAVDLRPIQASIAASEKAMRWTSEAERIMERIPAFARSMACRAIESSLIKEGRYLVTPEDVMRMAPHSGGRHK